MRAPTVLLATACLLAAGTVGYLLRPPQPAAPAVGQVARGALEPPDAAVTAADLGLSPARELQPGQLSRSIAAPPGAVAPLPPLDLPLEQILAELEQRAAAGDAAAACRLAAEVAACSRLRFVDPAATEAILAHTIAQDTATTAYDDQQIVQMAEFLERQERAVSRCDGVAPAILDQRAHHDLRAARMGDLGAAERFIMADDAFPGLLMRDPSLVASYRENAWPLLQTLLQAGHPAAATILARATMDGPHAQLEPISAVVPEGWISPGAAQHLALLVMEAGGDPAWPPESADADPAALHEARQMFERWFADSPLLQGYRPFAAGDFDAPRRACSKLLPGD